MSKAQRDKGKRWEQEAARLFREVYGEEVRRGWQARLGSDAPDVDGTPWWIECKVGARPNPIAALHQAQEAQKKSGDTRTPIAVCKMDRTAPTVTMSLEDFIQLIQSLKIEGVIP